MKGTKTTAVAKEIINKHRLTNDQLIVIFNCSTETVRGKKSRETYSFEDVARLCIYTDEDIIEKAHYIFGEDWFERISEMKKLKRKIEELRGR